MPPRLLKGIVNDEALGGERRLWGFPLWFLVHSSMRSYSRTWKGSSTSSLGCLPGFQPKVRSCQPVRHLMPTLTGRVVGQEVSGTSRIITLAPVIGAPQYGQVQHGA